MPVIPFSLRSGLVSLAALSGIAATPHARAQSDWGPIPGLHPGPSGDIMAVYPWDPDGPGPIAPRVVIGGRFNRVGSVDARHIAAWDGQNWHALGDGVPVIAQSLIEHAGSLYVGTGITEIQPGVGGGRFATIDGTGTALSRFDGTAWHPVAVDQPGMKVDAVPAMSVFQDQLVVAISQRSFGDILIGNGSSWARLLQPFGASAETYAFVAEPTSLFAGGHFNGGTAGVRSVSRWDGTAWNNLGAYRDTHCLLRFGADLYVGGLFSPLGGGVARWDGSSYQTVGQGLAVGPPPGGVAVGADLIEHDGQLVALGTFTHSGAAPVPYGAVWNGTDWLPLDPGMPARMYSGASIGGALYFGGVYRRLFRWDGSAVSQVPGELRSGGLTLALEYGNDLLALGTMMSLQPEGPFVANLFRYDGSDFQPLDSPHSARSMLVDGSDWYVVAPTGLQIGGVTPSVARFDRTTWHAVGGNADNGSPSVIAKHANGLVIAGSFTSIGGVSATRVAFWNGTAWGPLGSGLASLSLLSSIVSYQGSVFVGAGGIQPVASGPSYRVVRWTGTSWTAADAGLDLSAVTSLVSFNGDLLASGTPLSAGQPQRSVMRWTGTTWEPFGQHLGEGVRQLAVVNDILYAIGDIAIPGQAALCQVARWDGSAWVPELDSIRGGSAQGMTTFQGKPLVYGSFTSVNGQSGCFLAQPVTPCTPDLTTTAVPGSPGYGTPNGTLDSEDFFYFLAQYALANLAVCDLTTTGVPGSPGYGVPNGVLDSEDFFYYLTLYAAGC